MTDEIERLRHKYATEYPSNFRDRNYIWHPLNPVSIYYRQAQERAMSDLFREENLLLSELRVLDVGCGNGRFLRFLADLGTPPNQLYGIDLVDERINLGRHLASAGMTLMVGNAETLPWPDQYFDLVSQFTVFSSILDAKLRYTMAIEMKRVLKPGGYVLWYDMYRTRNDTLHRLPLSEIQQLFSGMVIRRRQSLHPIYAIRALRFGSFISSVWTFLPGVPRTHFLILLQKL